MPVRFQVDPDFYDHPKTIDASDAAVALWTRAGSYSTAKLLDGFVPDGMLARLSKAPDEAAGELVRRGLWRRVRGGYKFHQWGERNLTRERVEADREYEREKKKRQREGHAVPRGQPGDSRGNPPGVPPVSMSMSVSKSVSGSVSGQPPPPRCAEHLDNPDPPPCGRCAEARKTRNQWEIDRTQRTRDAPQCRRHRGQPAHNCAPCRSEQLATGGDR